MFSGLSACAHKPPWRGVTFLQDLSLPMTCLAEANHHVLVCENKPLIIINPDPQTALKYQFELRQYLNEEHVCLYPAEEFSPYDLSVFPVPSLKAQYNTLKKQISGHPAIYLISPKNLLLRHLSLNTLDTHALELKAGQVISPEDVTEHCLAMGYLRASLIKDPGEFSSRGDIFDLYPVSGEPVRIEFFGDTIETIRIIDVENQRSVQPALFLDAGNTFLSSCYDVLEADADRQQCSSGVDFGDLRYSVGVGLSWLTPVGPLTFSVAEPLNDESGDDTQFFQFSLGQTF